MPPLLNCELEAASIVLLGSLNPSIFQPKWLASKDLIRAREGTEAQIQIVSPEISSFTAEWLTVQVTRDRFMATTSDPSNYEELRDFVLSVFALLDHTPLTQMGVNRDMHYRIESVEKWHAVGHMLAPKQIWKEIMEDPGTESLTVSGRSPGSAAKVFRVTVQPSRRMPPGTVGVYIGTNEHFESEGGDGAQKLLSMLAAHWRRAMEYAKTAAERVLTDGRLAD